MSDNPTTAPEPVYEGAIGDLIDGPGAFEDGICAGMHRAADMLDREAARALARDPTEKTGHVLIANVKAIRDAANAEYAPRVRQEREP